MKESLNERMGYFLIKLASVKILVWGCCFVSLWWGKLQSSDFVLLTVGLLGIRGFEKVKGVEYDK